MREIVVVVCVCVFAGVLIAMVQEPGEVTVVVEDPYGVLGSATIGPPNASADVVISWNEMPGFSVNIVIGGTCGPLTVGTVERVQ